MELKLQINIELKDNAILSKELPNANLVSKTEIVEYPDVPGVKSFIYTFKTKSQADLFIQKIKSFLESKQLKGSVSLHTCNHSESGNDCVTDYLTYGQKL